MRHHRVHAAALLVVLTASGLAACGPAPGPAIFPTDRQTVADSSQITGRRVNLPVPDCTRLPSDCNDVRLINQLDGFDLAPQVTIVFRGSTIDITKVTRSTVFLRKVGTTRAIGLRPLVFEDSINTVFGQPEELLEESTRYEIVVTSGVNGAPGTSTFTTMSATVGLRKMVGQLDSGAAYTAAGIGVAQRGLDFVIGGQRRVYPAANVARPRRFDDLEVGSDDALVEQPVFDSGPTTVGGAGTYAFGSFLAPQWIDGDRKIPATATGGAGPVVRGQARVGFTMILPQATPTRPKPAGGWPVAIFGPGVTRSKYDLFLASDENLKAGIATVAIDPVGHAYGPATRSGVDLVAPPSQIQFAGFGRAVDVEGDGIYGARDGLGTRGQPATFAGIALRDGLRQTAADNMTLARAIARGVDVDGDGAGDLRPTGIGLYAQSLGGIYGTMVMGADPSLLFGALNVPGGPIIEIARLGSFRCDVTLELGRRVPSLLNGGDSGCDPARQGFTESTPLYLDPPETNPAPGAIAIQRAGSRGNWIQRSGSPDAFAPLLRLREPTGHPEKKVLYQYAYADQTVPNPASANLMRAGGLQDVTSFYRNDKTPTASMDPHGFLLDPRVSGRQLGQLQIAEFLVSGGTRIIDPDGTGPLFEVPINPTSTLERRNQLGPTP